MDYSEARFRINILVEIRIYLHFPVKDEVQVEQFALRFKEPELAQQSMDSASVYLTWQLHIRLQPAPAKVLRSLRQCKGRKCEGGSFCCCGQVSVWYLFCLQQWRVNGSQVCQVEEGGASEPKAGKDPVPAAQDPAVV